MTYRIFGVSLHSDLPLPELAPWSATRTELRAYLRRRQAPRRRGARWEPLNRQGWMTVSRRPGEWRLQFGRAADFLVSDDASVVRAWAPATTPSVTVRHLLIDQVLPLMLSARGHLVLHGSAVRGSKGGILLAGGSGSGKSTLAVGLMLAGWKLLSDDLLRIQVTAGTPKAIAAYPGARLWPDVLSVLGGSRRLNRLAHYSDKRRLAPESLAGRVTGASALRRVYLLGDSGGDISITPVSRRDALMALLANTTRLDTNEPDAERSRLGTLSDLCEAIPVRRLSYPRDLNRLDDVRRAIIADLSSDR